MDGVPEPVALRAGDCFVLPGGRPFVLGSDLRMPPMLAPEVFAAARRGGTVTHNGGGGVLLVGSRFTIDGRHSAMLGQVEAQRLQQHHVREVLGRQRGARPVLAQLLHHPLDRPA